MIKPAFRRALSLDIPALHTLIEASVRGLQQADYTARQMDGAIGHTLGLDTQLIEDETYFVATLPDAPQTIVACGGWSFRRTLFGSDHGPVREDTLLDPATEAAKIRAIFVHPDYARRGLGTQMLAHCEAAAAARGFGQLEMGSTLTGVSLYTLRGYRSTGSADVPLPNGETLRIVMMTKTLPAQP